MLCEACGYSHNMYELKMPFLQLSFVTEDNKEVNVYSGVYNDGRYSKQLIYLYRCPKCKSIVSE